MARFLLQEAKIADTSVMVDFKLITSECFFPAMLGHQEKLIWLFHGFGFWFLLFALRKGPVNFEYSDSISLIYID